MFALNIRFLAYNLLLIVVNDEKSYININTIYLMIQTVCFVLTEISLRAIYYVIRI